MRKKMVLMLTVGLAALIATSYFAWTLFHPQLPQKYEIDITRNLDNQEEESALAAAESINYSAITSFERFRGSSDPESYLHPDTYLTYTGANFIDSQVINYYQTRYGSLQGKGDPKQIELTYQANVSKYSDFRIYNSPAPQGVTWHNITIVMSAPNGSAAFNSGHIQFFYKNQSGYQMTEWEYDFNLVDCFVVEMKLQYSEAYAPVAGFFVTVHQIVVLDQNFEPVLIGLESGTAVA